MKLDRVALLVAVTVEQIIGFKKPSDMLDVLLALNMQSKIQVSISNRLGMIAFKN